MELSPSLLNINRITNIACFALSVPEATVSSWHCAPIAYANVGGDSRGLFRINGTATTSGQRCNWTVILKVFRPLPDGSTTSVVSNHYWKREALAYTSGLVTKLPEGVRVPRCYDVEEMEDGSLWLWMEEVQSDVAPPWPLSRFRLAAYHLGLLNGQYLVPHSLPQYEWLSNSMTRAWAEENAYTISLIEQTEVWEVPPLCLTFTQPVRERLLHLWDERETFYETLASLPTTLCHHDVGHRNLFSSRTRTGVEQTMLIDWELVGYGAVGEELGNLFAPALINFEVEQAQAQELANALLDGYTEGLNATGWQGDVQMVRLGFAISAIFRWVFASAGWPVAIVTDPSGRAKQQTLEQWGKPLEQVYQQWAGLTYYLLNLAEEVR